MEDPSDLDGAYALRTPEDNRRYYAGWANRYDTDFAARMAYRLPDLVAAAYVAAGGQGPVLDVGAGTGLLGVALAARGTGPVDGLDLSPEMLDLARAKGCYRSLWQADLTAPLPALPGPWAGMASSGTFTHGHLGPGVLGPLLALLAPGAVVALSVNAGVWTSLGFPEALASLPVGPPRVTEAAIYGDGALDPAHAADRAMIVTFTLSRP